MTESDCLRRAIESKDVPLLSVLGAHKLQLQFHFGFHAAADRTIADMLKTYILKSAMRFHFQSVMLLLLFTCLNYYELARAQQSK
jgi:hypothetical protein